jgi:serine/threonine protein kinase
MTGKDRMSQVTKMYGNRWEIERSLSGGGQADVFVARDRQNSTSELVALKRIRNPNRHPRFKNEVAAIERLDHPNIIKLIDHSALDTVSDSPEKQYLVMPLASGGDLSKCVGRFKDNLDGTLIVVYQLASALRHAHAAGVIHRDVKPQNILFAGSDNDVWLTDFGICFLRDQERHTAENEAVGPWAFIAPELEGGGHLEVTPAADIYSLGKVIYYMISGGTVLPRERLADVTYAELFSRGGRYDLLRLLLDRMVCPAQKRIQSMDDVIRELEQIQHWDRNAKLAPISDTGASKLEQLRRSILDQRHIAELNEATAIGERELELQVRTHILELLRDELQKFATTISEGGALNATVADATSPRGMYIGDYVGKSGLEVVVHNFGTQFAANHVLQLAVCQRFHVTYNSNPGVERQPIDHPIVILPAYGRRASKTTMTTQPVANFYIAPPAQIFAIPEVKTALRSGLRPQQVAGRGAPQQPLYNRFLTSEWPGAATSLKSFLTQVCDAFIDILMRNKDNPFPR